MAITYGETDNAVSGADSIFCSGTTVPPGGIFIGTAEVGGSPGTLANTVDVGSSATNQWAGRTQIAPAANVSWDSGTWTVRMEVTTSNMNLTWAAVYICRTNSSHVNQATIGSATSLGISLGTTGVKSTTVSGASQSPGAGDLVEILWVFSNGAMSTQSFGMKHSQNIDSPFNVAAVDLPTRPIVRSGALSRSYNN